MGVQEERERGGSQDIIAGRESRAQLRQMLLIGLVASVVGIAVALAIDWFPVAASTQAKKIDTLWDVLLVVSVPIFVLVEVVVLFSVWKFRMKPGEELKDGPPIHGNTRLEIIWTAIPATLLVALCGYAYATLTDIESAKADTMKIRVVGEQFAWTYYYTGAGEGGRELASNQLYVPVDRPVLFTIQSKDVIHDFWVPAFRMKIDAVPGNTTHLNVTPDRVGTYPVVCAELCGLGHSVMRSTVNVVPRGTFNRWLERQRQAGQRGGGGGGGQAGGGGGGAVDGKTIFTQGAQPACASCHTLADAGADATTGPNLDQVLKGMSPEQIRQSIVDPNAEIAKGFSEGIMPPNYGESLDPREIDALVDYLVKSTR
jgi:cytochrome c oxidase subunit 2